MDRSYPYSRRLTSRARLHKRMLAVAAAGVLGATALCMQTWTADPISAAVAPHAQPLAAMAGATTDTRARKLRRIYPYSVIPGGVSGQAELARVIRTDRVVATHYASFDVDKAHPVVVEKPRAVHVSYRKNGKVYWTARKLMLAEGETLLSDGRNEMRARCANRISDVPQYPVEAHQPDMEELDNPVEVDDSEQLALGADGLPVSIDPTEGLARPLGQRFAVSGGNGFLGAPSGSAPADTLLAGTSYSSSTATGSPATSMGLSGSSSSLGSRPRPDSNAPLTPPPSAAGADGGSGSSSGTLPPSSVPTVPAPTPDKGADTQPDPAVPDTVTTPTPAPSGAPVQEPAPAPAPIPVPGPTPNPTPNPLPPVFTPDPLPQPGGGQSGGGSTDEPPPPIPTAPGPLFPQPGTETEPFIPQPEPTPPPHSSTDEPDAPANVPEPGGWTLAAIGLAALYYQRRGRLSLKRGS
jgi:hypothetical protein